MELRQAIIHELIKERIVRDEPTPTPSIIEGNLLDVSSIAVTTLINSILNIYGTKGNSSSQGTFDLDGGLSFPGHIDHFIEQSVNSTNFEELSKLAMACLLTAVQSENLATGGYIVFGHYASSSPSASVDEEMLLIAMVKKRDGITLQNLIPKTVQEVDLSKLHQAVRINVTRYKQWKENTTSGEVNSVNSYLSFISPKVNKTTSGYFVKAMGCTNAVADRKATKDVLSAVSAFFANHEQLKESKKTAKEEVAQKLFERSKSENPECSLDTVDAWVTAMIPEELQPELANKFTEFANNEPYNVPSAFKSNSTEAKNGISLKIASKEVGWSMNMERCLLGTDTGSTIQYDKSNKKLIIRELPSNIMRNLDAALDIPSDQS